MKTLLTNPDLCTGCNRCTYGCSAKNEGVFAPALARLSINTYALQGFSAPSVCFQCKRPDCLEACPEQAITKTADGIVVVDADICTGCGACVPACAWGMIAKHPGSGKAFKCDLCGGDPACAKECTFGALVYADPDKDQTKVRAMQMKHRSNLGGHEQKRDAYGKALLNEAQR